MHKTILKGDQGQHIANEIKMMRKSQQFWNHTHEKFA